MFLRSPRENSKNLPFTPSETYHFSLVEIRSAVLTLSLLLLLRVCPDRMTILTLHSILWTCACPSRLPLKSSLLFSGSPRVGLLTAGDQGLAHSPCPRGMLKRGCL